MPNVVVQTIASEAMNAAVAANTGWQRAASHRIGHSTATGATISQGFCGSERTMTVITAANAASATTPSMISLRRGGTRIASARPITSGAAVMIPTAPDANQCCHVVQSGAAGPRNNLYATVPPIAEAAVAMTAAASRPSTLRSVLRLK